MAALRRTVEPLTRLAVVTQRFASVGWSVLDAFRLIVLAPLPPTPGGKDTSPAVLRINTGGGTTRVTSGALSLRTNAL